MKLNKQIKLLLESVGYLAPLVIIFFIYIISKILDIIYINLIKLLRWDI
jgi:hypothetical protein